MRGSSVLLFALPLALAGATAHADALPDPDPYEACEELKLGVQCFSTLGSGYCVEVDCPDNPGQKCRYCDPNATETTGADTVGTTDASTGTGTTADTTGTAPTGGSSEGTGSSGAGDGSTSDGTTPKKEDAGCGCRSDASPGAALALLGLVGLLRRRRR